MIPNSLLLELHDNGSHRYITQVTQCIKGEVVSLDPNCKRLELALQRAASKLATRKKSCTGSRGRAQVKDGLTKILVGQGETVAVARVAAELEVRICQFVWTCCVLLGKYILL